MLLEDLQKFQSKRKFPNWQPRANTGKIVLKYTAEEEMLCRCLEFVDLELQVGEWVSSINLGEEVNAILRRNAEDEIKHELAIKHLQDYYSYSGRSAEAKVLCDRWKANNDNPAVAAYALEMGVFFTILPKLMKCGDVYAATVASWINDDERVHVETNLRLMKYYGIKLSYDVVKLVYETVAYITMSKSQATRAVERLVNTKDPEMLTESLPITISYFEQNSNSDIVYS